MKDRRLRHRNALWRKELLPRVVPAVVAVAAVLPCSAVFKKKKQERPSLFRGGRKAILRISYGCRGEEEEAWSIV